MRRRGELEAYFATEVGELDVVVPGVELPVSTLLRVALLFALAVSPIMLAAQTSAAARWSARFRPGARRIPTGALAFSAGDSPGASESEGSVRPRESSVARPVDRFYRVTFADEKVFRTWSERALEFTATLQEFSADLIDPRPVAFVQLTPRPGSPPVAYVSEGARGLASVLIGMAHLTATPVSLWELPDGLTMLFGHGVDADAYERRGERGRRR
jgi:hypothetical protein